MAVSSCHSCLGLTLMQSLKLSMLINILKKVNPMAATDTNSLLNYGKCFACAGLSAAEIMELSLLDQINANVAGTNAPVVYVADPNTEALTPADVLLPCLAYSADGTGSIYGWDITGGQWV